MYQNPWEPNTEARKALFAKLNREQETCNACKKTLKCTAVDRMDAGICGNLRDRLGGGK